MSLRSHSRALALVLIALTLGCARGGGDEVGSEEGVFGPISFGVLGARADVAYESLTAELAQVRRELAAGRVPRFACEAAALFAQELQEEHSTRSQEALREYARLCRREVPLAGLSRALLALEESAEVDPAVRSELCDRARRAADILTPDYGEQPAVADLTGRFEAACP